MRIHVTRQIPQAGLDLLYASGWDIFVGPAERPGRERFLWAVGGADGILSILTERIDGEVMDLCPNLKVISNMAVGVDNIDVVEARKRGVVVRNTPGVLTESCADFTWALLLGVARRIGEGERMMRADAFPGWGPLMLLGHDVHGKTLGIVGAGGIGRAVARRAQGFNMRVLTWSRTSPPPPGCQAASSFEELLRSSDFVSLHVPLTPSTRHLVGEEQLRMMGPHSYLINTSRGPVVDEAALVRALQENWIAGAALDVFENEPKLTEGLRQCQNALLLPHLASASRETREAMAVAAATNLIEELQS